ncbi:hypothetical protein NADFUDRAFT_52032 [Nadsonia fulvescens var. elongata DSM 6958]|uniref:Phosphomethylpyrimidine kinase n=1 Tax=Nadsonia fulvescens var. elongata DSM 6958 TaxID=857566 RepID=A0A1E3PJG6_9ASCO|nr:hypothetical protein NADFUDRAFT_52032 [Nadsonia fulvescens var. elongata DSM 6958]
MSTIGRVITIAGSDSSGGAGIEADLKTMTAHGCYGMTCITGLTAQNTMGVKAIYPVTDQSFISSTLEAVFSDIGVDVVKTGMLTSKETITTVARFLQKNHKDKMIVVDPVMITTSGSIILIDGDNAIKSYIEDLFPLATVLTPNLAEAQFIAKHITSDNKFENIQSLKDIEELAKFLYEHSGSKNILMKGGHLFLNEEEKVVSQETDRKIVVDVLYDGSEFHHFKNAYLDTPNTHGTGCTLASAIASNLAKGIPLVQAVEHSIKYVQRGISEALPLITKGSGPLNHLHPILRHNFPRGHFVDYLLNHPKVKSNWEKYTKGHEFVIQLATGKLPLKNYRYFLVQDYHYLIHYARAHGLAAFKAPGDLEATAASAQIIMHIKHEMTLHLKHCKEMGLSVDQILAEPESLACVAYTRYILEVGAAQDWLALQMALSPCLIGYYEAARYVKDSSFYVADKTLNMYADWVETYVADDFVDAVNIGKELLEKHIWDVSPQRVEELVDIFAMGTSMEVNFWTNSLVMGK